MRSGYVRNLEQLPVNVGLVAPCVYYNGAEFGHGVQQGSLVHYLSSGGVDEEGAELHLGKECGVCHVPRFRGQGYVHGYDVRFAQEVIEVAELGGAFYLGPRRVVLQHVEAEQPQCARHPGANVADADDANRKAVQVDALARGRAVHCRQHVVHDGARIAARGVLHMYAAGAAVIQVDMVVTDCCSGDYLNLAAVQQSLVALGAGADYQRIRVLYGSGVNLASDVVVHGGIVLEHALNERYVFVYYYCHLSISS